jgi:hypothetical protein
MHTSFRCFVKLVKNSRAVFISSMSLSSVPGPTLNAMLASSTTMVTAQT